MMTELIRRAGPYVLAVVLVMGAVVGIYCLGYTDGRDNAETEWQAKWSKQEAVAAQAEASAMYQVRVEEQRRQSAIDRITQDAEQQITQAKADADAASAAADILRQQAHRLAARASQCASHPNATQGGDTASQPSMVLADVLGRADERAGELAAAYDRAHAAGLACERAYLALMATDGGA